MRVSVSGGAPLTIGTVDGDVRGAGWGSDGWIVFNNGSDFGLSRIFADSGVLELLTTPIRERGEKTHRLPEMLPGGKAALFTFGNGEIASFNDASIAALSLETGEYSIVLEGGTQPRYSETGHLIYARAGALLAVPFDLGELQVKGSPVPVIQGVTMDPTMAPAQFSISREGSLLYAPGDSWGRRRRVVWVDREGRAQPLLDTPRAYGFLRLSPDGSLLAVDITGANEFLWMYDTLRGTLTRLTFSFDSESPVWTPDGLRLAYVSTRAGRGNIFWQAADGADQAERLTRSENYQRPHSWSPDGKALVYAEERPETRGDIWILPLEDDREPQPFLKSRFYERWPRLSPNGRWIAYESDESGRYEIYLRPFPGSVGKQQVSDGGGFRAVWNPNGRELFYRNGAKMMVVEVQTEGELILGNPRLLFERTSLSPSYDVAPDGQRFVMIEEGEPQPAVTQLVLVQNWAEELKRLVSTN